MKKIKYTQKVDVFIKIVICSIPTFFILANTFAALCYADRVKTFFWADLFGILFLIFGFILVVFPYVVEEDAKLLGAGTAKPQKYVIPFSSFDSFFEKAHKSFESKGLKQISVFKKDDYELYLYATQFKKTNVDFVLILNTEEFNENIWEDSLEAYVNSVPSFYRKTLNLNLITMICVRRITPDLRSILNFNAGFLQDYSKGRFLSAISFGRKNLYVSEQKGLVGKIKYKKAKSRFKKYFDFLFNFS